MMHNDEPSLGKKLAFYSIGIGLALALVAGLGELVLRAIAPKSDSAKIGETLEGSARIFGLKPRHRSLSTGVIVQTNSLGFREREYPVEREPGVRRLVVLGDSYTFGTGVEFAEIYSKRLEAGLNRTGQRYEVINFGVPGYNTTQELATLREVAARFRPDLVILGYVLNDTARYVSGERRFERASFADRVHLGARQASMLYKFAAPKLGALAQAFDGRFAVGVTRSIIASFQDDDAGWIESRTAIVDLASQAKSLGAATLVVVFPMMVQPYPLQAAHAAITRFCRSHGIDVLDLMPVVLEHEVSDLVVPLDGHPNGRGHGIFAERILEHLLQNQQL